jgi:osmoprotectant transport system ATP-binding protein
VAEDDLRAQPGETVLAQVPLTAYGHTFRVDSDSLRAARDATVLSATGQAVGVDADGRVVGITSYERLRTAIQRADQESRQAAPATSAAAASASAASAAEGVPAS